MLLILINIWCNVSDRISGVLTVIDGVEGKIIDSTKIGKSLWDLDINNNNGKLYVSDLIQNKIIVIDTKNLEIIKTIPVNQSPWAITINEKTDMIYVASGISEIIHVIDGETDNIIREISSDVKPWGLAVNEKNNTLYITSWDSNKIIVIELDNNQKIQEHIITPGAWQIEIDQKTGMTIISNEHANELYLFDEKSEWVQTILTDNAPQFIASSSKTNTIYVTNPLSNSVSMINYEGKEVESTRDENDRLGNNLETQELILEVVDGIVNIPQRQDVDTDLISGLIQNLGVTGEFNGNNIAQLLLEDYNKKKDLEPKKVSTPIWVKDIAMRFTESEDSSSIQEEIDCNDHSFPPVQDIENANPFDIWIKILPICALS